MPNVTERYEAVVSSIEDPEKRGRFKVKCVGLMGDAKAELPIFVELVPGWGWFIVPEVGEIVEIEVIVTSDRDEIWGQASIEALNPVWRGKRFVTSRSPRTRWYLTTGRWQPRRMTISSLRTTVSAGGGRRRTGTCSCSMTRNLGSPCSG
ncbi:hypothetical protein LCGC14_1019680 [marine sediment metagenome]|uniref:Uncharacterized protein n=1 Tax=marine sediment metagenome TaxID=412755 RepID=A0A0F9N2C6_9ZZZZ